MKDKIPVASSGYMGPVFFGFAVIFLTFGVAGGWAAIAPLDSAVTAPGVVAVANNRKSVQHLEGGIVSEIKVEEGDTVEQGDVLFHLDTTQALASETLVTQQLYAARVLEARLLAERDGEEKIELPEVVEKHRDLEVVQKAIADEQTQFEERKESIDNQIGILNSRIDQSQTRIDGLKRELASTREQIGFIRDELGVVKGLKEKGLVSATRVNQLERERARLEGVIGRSTAEISGTKSTIGEAKLQIQQIRQERLERAAKDITDVRRRIYELKEKSTVSGDILKRTAIVAPRSGKVISLKVFTRGQVIRAGEVLMEIVPQDEGLVVNARVSPLDIESMHRGMKAEVRFPSFKSRQTPIIFGTVRDVSADRLVDEQNRQSYYEAKIIVANEDIPKNIRGRLKPGMPGNVIVATGERTVLQYLANPLETALSRAFTEE